MSLLAVSAENLASTRQHVSHHIERFGADRQLITISVADIRKWDASLRRGGLSAGTRRHHLNAVSNLYRYATSEGYVPPGSNPVAALLKKPVANRQEARWLEVHQAALLLEAARTRLPSPSANAHAELAYALVATFLLTGGRSKEVLGLEVEDVSFDRKTITFGPTSGDV